MRVAVIDLGTNTFNLIVAEQSGNAFVRLFGKKLPAKLGAEKINENELSPQAMGRGIACLQELKSHIDQYSPDQTFAFATSAVRSAKNASVFVERAKAEAGIEIRVISGDKEAELIYYGNRKALELPEYTSLILDIGGGSNEFILCNKSELLWKKSFDLGTFRIIQRFDPQYPVGSSEIADMESYFESQLGELFAACDMHNPRMLIGSSGSFDSFRAMLEHTTEDKIDRASTSFPISIEQMQTITERICGMSLEELATVPEIDKIRVEIITVATIFIWYIVKRLGIEEIEQSSYSLKEGVIFKLFENETI